ncbi:MAG: hypothetical protein M3R53_09385 [Candidatus Eremiobacteraeota bacterium]|nr:hypothetical protein [Candidatus Eremiobacteraeota bacterium]
MEALAYLELRYAAHQAAAILRSPARLVLWIPYLISIAFLGYARIVRHPGSHVGLTLTAAHATGLGSAYLALLFVAIALAAGGRVTAFRTGAEAIFFSNAGVRPLAVVVWLQLRKLSAGWMRLFGGALYVFVLFAPRQVDAASTALALLATLLALALQNTVELPAFLLSRGRFNAGIRVAAWGAAIAAFALAGIGFFAEPALQPVLRIVRVDPGVGARAALAGSPSVVVALAALLAILVASIAVLGADALPEIYGAALQTLVRQKSARSSPVSFTSANDGKVARIPAGALTLVWKDWIAFRRGRGALRLWLAACGFWSFCGAGVAYVAARYDDATPLVTLGAMTALMLFAFTPVGAAAGLAADLAKPMFWLSAAPLRERIAAWTFGRTWRGAVAIGLAPFAAGVAARDVTLAIAALPLTFAIYWSLQALGVGLYALFPNAIDARGPLGMIRPLVTLAFALPPSLAAVLALTLQVSALGAALAAAVIFIIEGILAVELASHRFYERGATLGTLSRGS